MADLQLFTKFHSLQDPCEGCSKCAFPPAGEGCLLFPRPENQWQNGKCLFYDGPITVYLAGSIQGRTFADANEWRLQATALLVKRGYRVLNPLRGQKEGDVYCPQDVISADLMDVKMADIILVEMDTRDAACIGTSMEIREAYRQGKIVVLWGTANQASYWLQYHQTKWFPELRLALDYLVNVLPGWLPVGRRRADKLTIRYGPGDQGSISGPSLEEALKRRLRAD
ncbi:MAG: hypothetical protein C4570_06515 [Ammonifex sp.]|nr:MAG: hypothetical protein C4570_06515 [Ammonifex sp.]